jgi:lipid-A-disaccharide synthase
MKYYIIAGEASGDLHGSNLIKELRKIDAAANFRAWGGDKMQEQGITLVKHFKDLAFMGFVEVVRNLPTILVKHFKDLAFMGFVEVVRNLPTILHNLKFCKQDILQYKPDAIIMIDYPGFNLRLVKWAKENGLKVIFYISPQVWAWKESRVENLITKYVDKMIVILPFEKEFYKKYNYDVDYIGHPLVEVIDTYKQQATGADPHEKNVIALLPGSRKQEIKRKLPIMLATASHFPQYNFILAKAPGITHEFYKTFLSDHKNITTASSQTYSILLHAKAALVTSGTATLETALFGVPQVVCYKAGWLSYQIAKRLVKLKFISLVNLIMNKEVVKELIQDELTVEKLKHELHELLTNETRIAEIKKDYTALKNLLSEGGNASANAARIIYDFTNSNAGEALSQ